MTELQMSRADEAREETASRTTDQSITGTEAEILPVGSVVQWCRDRRVSGYRMHTPTDGWVPALGGRRDDYAVIFVPTSERDLA